MIIWSWKVTWAERNGRRMNPQVWWMLSYQTGTKHSNGNIFQRLVRPTLRLIPNFTYIAPIQNMKDDMIHAQSIQCHRFRKWGIGRKWKLWGSYGKWTIYAKSIQCCRIRKGGIGRERKLEVESYMPNPYSVVGSGNEELAGNENHEITWKMSHLCKIHTVLSDHEGINWEGMKSWKMNHLC